MTSSYSPGFHYEELFNKLPPDIILEMLEHSIKQMISDSSISQNLYSAIASDLVDMKTVIHNSELLQKLIDHIPSEKHNELVKRCGLDKSSHNGKLDAEFFNSYKKIKNLLEFLGIHTNDTKEISEPTKKIISPKYPFYEYQLQVAQDAYRRLKTSPRTVMIHMPTGSGKTRTAMHIVARYFREQGPTTVLWLASVKELIEQAADSFEKAWETLGERDCTVVRWYGNANFNLDQSVNQNALIVAGLQKLCAVHKRSPDDILAISKKVSLIVFDEAHQAIAPVYKSLIEFLRLFGQQEMALLGLSATPGRSSDEESNRLSDFFHKEKVSIKTTPETCSTPIKYLIENGYIANVKFRKIDFPDASIYEKRSRGGDYSTNELSEIGEVQSRNRIVFSEAKKLLDRHDKIIIFSPSVVHARFTAALLKAEGHQAYAVSAETPKEERSYILKKFSAESRTPQALCNFGVFTTGLDVPAISAALVARPTRSLVLYSQMVGRAIRGERSGGNKQADVVTVVDTTLPGFQNLIESFSYWEDIYHV